LKESSDGETLIAAGMWFQICAAVEEKAQETMKDEIYSAMKDV